MRLTVQRKLMGSFVLVLILMGAATYMGINGLLQMADSWDRMHQLNSAVNAASRLDAAFATILANNRGYMLIQSPDYKQGFEKARADSEAIIKELSDLAAGAETAPILERIKRSAADFGRVSAQLYTQQSFTREQVQDQLTRVLAGPRQELVKEIEELTAVLAQLEKTTQDEADAEKLFDIEASIGAAVVAAILGILVSYIISRRVAGTVTRTAQAAQRLAEGDLSVSELTATENDEIGDMARAFNEMLRGLRTLISQVTQSSVTVSSAADQLSAATEQIAAVAGGVAQAVSQVAQGASSQSTAALESARIVGEVRAAITQIAAGAQEQARGVQLAGGQVADMVSASADVFAKVSSVASSADQALSAARSGSAVVARTVQGMDRIQDRVMATAEQVQNLSSYSEKIGLITGVITDLAGRTNLLALNAAIEAARAGEHGRGFAVVADEVRKLAEQSAASAKEIALLIQSIQAATGAAAKAMEEGTQEVRTGAGLAAEAGAALDRILTEVERTSRDGEAIHSAVESIRRATGKAAEAVESVASVTEENTAATEEMAAGSEEVVRAVQEIAAVSEQNAAAAEEVSASIEELNANSEEMAASAKELSGVAKALQAQVSRFRL